MFKTIHFYGLPCTYSAACLVFYTGYKAVIGATRCDSTTLSVFQVRQCVRDSSSTRIFWPTPVQQSGAILQL